MTGRKELRQQAADNGVPLALAGVAFGGSFAHWVHLAAVHGQRGLLAPATAVCVDLGIYMAARERQHDLRSGRGRRGWASWPTLVMSGGIALTLAGQVASAQWSPWGVITALIPGAFLLVAISLMERRAAERGRRQLAADDARDRQAAAERDRQARLAADAERQAAAARRQAELAARLAASVTQPSATVTGNGSRLALLPPPAADQEAAAAPAGVAAGTLSATEVMRAFWTAEVAAGRVPSGAELGRAAGLSPASSLGRQLAARWRQELPGQQRDGATA